MTPLPKIGDRITTQDSINIIRSHYPRLSDLADKLEGDMVCPECKGECGFDFGVPYPDLCRKCKGTGIIDPYLPWVYDGVSLFPEQLKKVTGEKALLALRKAWNWMLEKIWPGIGHKAALSHDFRYAYGWEEKEKADREFESDCRRIEMSDFWARKFHWVVDNFDWLVHSAAWRFACP